jgi:hypothetical protein
MSMEEEIDHAKLTIDDLIAQSSFGSPEALRMRAQCPPEIRDEILAKVRASMLDDQATRYD